MSSKSVLDERTAGWFFDALPVFDIEDPDEQERAARKLLERDPDDPFAAYIAWQLRDDDEDIARAAEPLVRAAAALKEPMERALDSSVGGSDDIVCRGGESAEFIEVAQLYAQMLSDLSAVLFFADELDDALSAASDHMRWNMSDDGVPTAGEMVYYSVMIKRKAYDDVIDSSMREEPTPFALHACAIAEFEKNGPTEEATNALLAAISSYPDLPFFVMGYWELPEEPDESYPDADELDLISLMADMLTDLWNDDEGRMAFFGAVVFAFGYITGRIDDSQTMSDLENGYSELGCLDEMRAARERIAETDEDSADDAAVIEFCELRDRGFF